MAVPPGEEMKPQQDQITRCPFCTASFRVRFEQLHTASGTVRCGACLRIFQADDAIVQGTAENVADLTTESNEVDDQDPATEEISLGVSHAQETLPLLDESSYWLDWEYYVIGILSETPGMEDPEVLEQFLDPTNLEWEKKGDSESEGEATMSELVA